MALFGLPTIGDITGGEGGISGGQSTTGPIGGVDNRFAPVNIGGLFGSASSGSDFVLPALIIGGVVLAVFFLRK